MVNKSGCKQKGRGFTLIELVVVVSIVGVIAAIAIPTYFGYIDTARITVSISVLDTLRKDMEAYNDQYHGYPVTVDFTNFTDQNGNSILFTLTVNILQTKMFSWDSYAAGGGTYTITAKAMDSKHTVFTLTPEGIKK
jgi:prepilin-type N-terminal cleavage/methylation domain-containing protein